MPITGLEVHDVGPFSDIAFDFDEKVNVFTGPNNSGKSTVLMLLGELLVYPFGVPEKLFRIPEPRWKLTYSSSKGSFEWEGVLPSALDAIVPIFSEVGFVCYVPALRASTDFRSSGPTVGQNVEEQLDLIVNRVIRDRPDIDRILGPDLYKAQLRERWYDEHPELAKRLKLLNTDSLLVYDRYVIQRLVNLDYASYRRNEPAIRELIARIASLASEITSGYPLTYLGVAEDQNGLYPQFETPDGKLPFNVLSQGTQSLIQSLAHIIFGYAQFYDFSSDYCEKSGIVIIDEIDAHLHPSWQQGVLPTLTRNFPNLQFFCSTHSPLTLSGLEAGQVQLLHRENGSGDVTVTTNESDILGWTADEVLRNLLGVRNPTDLTTAKNVVRLQELRRKDELSPEEIKELQNLRFAMNRQLFDGADSL